MKYNELNMTRQKKPLRKGRGIAAGRGMTAGRGTKGQGARKSGGVRPGFEGGQMPIYMRIPKLRGFRSHAVKGDIVYTSQLEAIKKTNIDNQALVEAGFVANPHTSVKVLTKGELSSKKDVKLQSVSKSAEAAIKKAGGTFTQTPRIGRTAKKPEKE